MSIYPQTLSPKDVWEYPPFRIRYVYDSTASAETNSSTWTELKSYTITLSRPLGTFKLRIRCTRRARNTTSGTKVTYFRAVITADSQSYIVDLGAVSFGIGQTDSLLDTVVTLDLQLAVSSLNISLQAYTSDSAMYASYQPPTIIEVGYLFSSGMRMRDNMMVPPEVVNEELEQKIDKILRMLEQICKKLGIVL